MSDVKIMKPNNIFWDFSKIMWERHAIRREKHYKYFHFFFKVVNKLPVVRIGEKIVT